MFENWQLVVFDKYLSNWGHEFLIFIFLILGPPIVLVFFVPDLDLLFDVLCYD